MFTVLTFMWALTAVGAATELPLMYRLKEAIFKDYDPQIEPVRNINTYSNLSMDITLFKILDVDEVRQTLTLSLWMNVNWTDEYIKWDPRKFENISETPVPLDKLWKPTLQPYNSVGNFRSPDIRYIGAKVSSDGQVILALQAQFELACNLQLTDYPYDVNTCYIRMYMHETSIRPTSVSLRIKGDEGEAPSTEFDVSVSDVAVTTEPFSIVQAPITLRRVPTFFQTTLLTPLSIILSLTMIVHLLPPDSEAKLDLLATVLVTYTLLLAFYQDQFPPARAVNQQVKRMIAIFIVIVAQMAWTVIIIRVSNITDWKIHPNYLRVSSHIGKLLLLPYPKYFAVATDLSIESSRKERRSPDGKESSTDGTHDNMKQLDKVVQWLEEQDLQAKIQSQWKYIGALADRITLLIMIAICTTLIVTRTS